MKKILLLVFLFPMAAISQDGWNYLPNAPVASARFDDLYFINDSTGWAANGEGEIYKTSDYGNSWTVQYDNFLHYFRSIEFLDSLNGFAGTLDTTVFQTTDGGITWNPINQNFPQQVPGVCGIGHFDSTIIMVGLWNQPAYILRSTDAGTTWTYIDMTSHALGLIDCWFKNEDTVFVSGMGINATDRGVILRSSDGGITWEQVGISPNPNTYCWKLHFTSSATGFSSCEELTTTSSNILKTIDGGATWFPLFVVNVNIDMEGIGFVNDSVGWVGGWGQGMYQTNDGGNNWFYLDFGQNLNRFTFLNAGLGYAAGRSIYKFNATIPTAIHSTTSSENKYIHQFEIYPNPPRDILKISLHINKSTNVIFEVYDTNGKLFGELAHGKLAKNTYQFEYDLRKLHEGNYYVVLRTNEHFLTKSFTVIK